MNKPSEQEEKFFLAQEQKRRRQLREEAERAAAELHARELVARETGGDLALADRVRALGFEGENARLLSILPLIAVAWADGSVTRAERAAVMQAVEARGVAPRSDAWHRAAAWLEEPPGPELRDQVLEILRQAAALDPGRGPELVDLARSVAAASGGILGFGDRISDEEREVIERIGALFGKDAHRSVTG